MIIAPSVLSLDYSDTKNQIEQLNNSKATWLHFDVMDGNFVPNLSFGPDVLKGFCKSSDLYKDVHIMVNDPNYYADVFMKAGANGITFHYETLGEEGCIKLAKHIQDNGCKAGICIKPKTDVNKVLNLLKYFDLVLVMSVEPGFGGQSFDETALDKIASLRKYIDDNQLSTLIEVDGGINDKTGLMCKDKGADILVAGSYIFSGDIAARVESLC